ncbi:MAG: DUF1499 domain-containing protein [Planctomyces sp.]
MSSTQRGKRPVFTVAIVIVGSVLAGCGGLLVMSLAAPAPGNLGVRGGRLAACPGSPNCVSTQAENQEHWIEPLQTEAADDSAISLLAEIMREQPRTTIVEQTGDYLRVEFRSFLFRFCDDVEFYHDRRSGLVHFRSASRVGHSDLGVNRRRMEQIREQFQRRLATAGGAAVESRGRVLELAGVR